MNIAIFSDCYIPVKNGVVTSIAQLKAGLETLGHRVIVFTVDAVGFHDSDPSVIRFRSIPIGLGTELRFGFVDQARVNRIMCENNIELVHSHTEFNLCISAMRAARRFRLPRVQTTHTMWEEYTHYILNGRIVSARVVRFFARLLYGKAHGLVAPSAKAADYYGRLLPGIPLRIIPNGLDTNRFVANELSGMQRSQLRENLGLALDHRVILFVGRIGREKRVLELFDALKPVLQSQSKCRLLFVGDGPQLNELKARARDLNLSEQVICTGYVEWESIAGIYGIADVFVTASLSEVHPMTMLEAMLCALPVVARKDQSTLVSVQSGHNGYLVESDAEIAPRVLELLNDATKRTAFGEASREIAKQFTGLGHARCMEGFYQEILGRFELENSALKASEFGN